MDKELDGWLHSVAVNSSVSKWKPVTSAVLQESILGPILFNIFNNDTESEIKCALNTNVKPRQLVQLVF